MTAHGPWTLHYWPSIPGRGEYVRLCFEAAGEPYKENNDVPSLLSRIMSVDVVGHPPHFAPPVLEFPSPSGKGSATVSQTPAILALIGPKFGLVGDREGDSDAQRELRRTHVNQLTLTVLDLSNEAHDVHHPIAVQLYYEDQKAEAKRNADQFRNERVPKFFKYFSLVIQSNPDKDPNRPRLVGASTTTADLALFQVIDGLQFAFPRLLSSIQKADKYPDLFALKESVGSEEKIAKHLSSGRRRKYGNGLFRYYPELDGELQNWQTPA